MAKRDDDDLDEIDDDEADEADDDVEDEAEDDADEDEADADEDEGDDDDGASDEDEEPAQPVRKPKITGLTLTLIILNVLASLGFLYLLLLNYERRQGFTHSGIAHEAALSGVGTEDDQKGATAGTITLPRPRLTPEEQRAALQSRGGSLPGGEPLAATEGGFDYHLYGVSEAERKELIKALGAPVATIEEEMRRLKTSLPGEIEAAATKILETAKTDAQKRIRVAQLLLPICFDTFQVEKLDKRIQAAQGAELDALVMDAAQRRIVADILNPVEIYRPGDVESNKPFIEKVADLDLMKLDDVKEALTRRLEAAAKGTYDGEVHLGKEWDNQPRWTVEKRQNAAFLLVSVAYARNHLSMDPKTPFEEQLLVNKGLERAQRIAGLWDFTTACENYTEALETLQDRVQAALVRDRDGFSINVGGQLKQSEGFTVRFADEIQSIRDLQLNSRRAAERQADLTGQREKADKLYKERLAHVKDVQGRINQARAQTAKDAEALRKLQNELFEAQRVLADAAEVNRRIEAEIRKLSASRGTGSKGTE